MKEGLMDGQTTQFSFPARTWAGWLCGRRGLCVGSTGRPEPATRVAISPIPAEVFAGQVTRSQIPYEHTGTSQ